MHIIIIGAGDVGYHLAKGLYHDHEVSIIDTDEEACQKASELDIMVIHGNGANIKRLENAGINESDLVVAVTNHDEFNIVVCLTSKLLTANKVKTIARVSNPEYIDEPVTVREKTGMDIMICPELSLALEMFEILSVPSAVHVENFVGGLVKMIEFKVDEWNFLVNKALKDIPFPQGSMISVIFRKSDLIIPDGNDIIQSGDRIVMIGKEEAFSTIRTWFEKENLSKRVLVVGGGKVGLYLIRLLSKNGFNITIIDNDKKQCEMIAEVLPDVLTLNGDGTDITLLEEVNTSAMDAVVSVTNSDEKNLLCSLITKQMGVNKVIARVDRTEYTQLFEMVGVDVAMSSRDATINEVMKTTLLSTGVQSITMLEGEKAEVFELTAKQGSKIVKKQLKNLKFPKGAIISTIVRGIEIIIPDGNIQIQPGDDVIIFTKPEVVSKVEGFFK